MIKGAKETTNFQVLKRKPTKIDNHQDSAVAKTHILRQMRITFQELKIQISKFQRIIDYAMKIAKHWVMNLIFTVPWVDMIGYNWSKRWVLPEPAPGPFADALLVLCHVGCRPAGLRGGPAMNQLGSSPWAGCSVAKRSKIERSALFPHLDFLQLHSKFIYIYNMYIICI